MKKILFSLLIMCLGFTMAAKSQTITLYDPNNVIGSLLHEETVYPTGDIGIALENCSLEYAVVFRDAYPPYYWYVYTQLFDGTDVVRVVAHFKSYVYPHQTYSLMYNVTY
jgi:hypothetical protein